MRAGWKQSRCTRTNQLDEENALQRYPRITLQDNEDKIMSEVTKEIGQLIADKAYLRKALNEARAIVEALQTVVKHNRVATDELIAMIAEQRSSLDIYRSKFATMRADNDEIRKQLNATIKTTALYRKRCCELESKLSAATRARDVTRVWLRDSDSKLQEITEILG